MRPTIEINPADLARLKSDFYLMDGEVPVALSRAINRALTAVNTEGSIQVRKVYNLKAARVKQNFRVKKTTRANLTGHWQSTGEPVGLIRYGATGNSQRAAVIVLKDTARKTVTGGFIQVGNNNQQHIFRRAKVRGVIVGRYPLQRLTGPRVEDALSKPEVQKALQNKADTTLQARLEHEANYILSKAR